VILEDLLKADGYDVIKKEVISESCLIDLVLRHKINDIDTFDDATAIIVLACESGYKCVKAVFNDKKIIMTMKTLGVGNYKLDGRVVLTSPFEWTELDLKSEGYPLRVVAEKLGLYASFFDAERRPEPRMVDVKVDGRWYRVREGSNLLEALLSLGFKIPHLCYASETSPAGICRLCLARIEGRRGLVPSCCTQVEEGMEVVTEDEEIRDLRRLILELILAEVEPSLLPRRSELRYWIRKYRIDKPRFSLPREEMPIDDSSEVLIRDLSRCILCGRCIRACAEVSGRGVLDFAYRGGRIHIAAGLDEPMGWTDCVSCMACVDSCPSGALVPKLIHRSFELAVDPHPPP
jgi:ferredoxin